MIYIALAILLILIFGASINKFSPVIDFVASLVLLVAEMFLFWVATENLNFTYSDLIVYYSNYVEAINWNWTAFLQTHQFEILYDFIIWLIAKLSIGFGYFMNRHDFVMVINCLKIVLIYFGLRKVKSGFFSALVASMFLWYQYSNLFSYNLLRQGLALSFLLVVIISFSKKRSVLNFIIGLVILCFVHKSMIYLGLLSGLGAVLINKKIVKRNWLYFFAAVGSVLYLTKLNSALLSRLPVNLVQLYQTTDLQGMAANIGSETNSLKYWLLTLLFLSATCLLYYNNRESKLTALLHDYIFIINIVYLFMGFIPFSFRIAMSAWFLFPVMLFVFIDEKSKNKFILYTIAVIFIVAEGWAAGPFTVLGG